MTPAAPTNHGIGEEEIARAIAPAAWKTCEERGEPDTHPVAGDAWWVEQKEDSLASARRVLALLRHSGNASAGGGVELSGLARNIDEQIDRQGHEAEPEVCLSARSWKAITAALRTRPASQSAGGEVERLVAFLREAAAFFERRPIRGEDHAFWANLFNAKNCNKAADTLEALAREIEALTRRCEWRTINSAPRDGTRIVGQDGSEFRLTWYGTAPYPPRDGWCFEHWREVDLWRPSHWTPAPASLLNVPTDGESDA